MNNRIQYRHLLTIVLSGILICTSCGRLGIDIARKTNAIKLNISSSSKSTKAAADAKFVRTIELKGDGMEPIFLSEYVSDNLGGFPVEEMTRGMITTTADINTAGKVFTVDAYLATEIATADGSEDPDKTNFHFIDNRQVSYSGSLWQWDGSEPLWRNGIATTFWSYYPVSVATRTIHLPAGDTPNDIAQKSLSFEYTLPAPAMAAPYQDAQNQKDLLFAYNNETYTVNNSGTVSRNSSNPAYSRTDNQVDITFYHALAAVKFDISGVVRDFTIKTIAIENVVSGGSCSVTGPIAVDSFNWTQNSDLKAYAQDFTADDDFEIGVGGRKVQKSTSEKVFFMIPQTLGEDARLAVTFEFPDHTTQTLYGDIKGDEWLPGKYYTYALSKASGDLGISLFDEGGIPMTEASDAHFSNAIIEFTKVEPTSYSISVIKPDGTVSTAPADAAWLRFAAPASSTSFASYPGASGSVDLAGLMNELMGSSPMDHFIDFGGYYYTQAFIDEYYLAGQPLSSFVNKEDRSVTLKISKPGKADASVTISQKAMQTPYNLTTAANPFGVELVEESTVTAGTAASNWCLSRNRDENGNGIMESSELKWRAPSLQEYWNIWYGTYSLDSDYWLGLSTSKAPTQYLSSDGYAYNGQLSTGIASPSGTGTVRCIRDLGSGSNLMYSFSEEAGDVSKGETDKILILTMKDISSESMRSKIDGREISGTINPGGGLDDSDNKLYSKIQVASKYLSWLKPTSGSSTGGSKYYIDIDFESADAKSGYYFDVTASGGVIKEINGKVKMLYPDARITYQSKFIGGTGADNPATQWSYIDQNGFLHFHSEYTGWNASNSLVSWKITAWVEKEDGTLEEINSANICSLNFVVANDSSLNGPWGTTSTVGKGGSRIEARLIGNEPIDIGKGNRCRLCISNGGDFHTDKELPTRSEDFDGTTTGVDDKSSAEYLCKTYYYEDERSIDGVIQKKDLGKWRAPSQRELSVMLANRADLKIIRMVESTSGIYVWEQQEWDPADKVSTPSIKNSLSSTPYYNLEGFLSTNGTAPYKVRCVRDRD